MTAKKSTKPPKNNTFLFVGVMTEQQKHILRQSWNKIVENVRSQDIIDYLIQVNSISTFKFPIHNNTVKRTH